MELGARPVLIAVVLLLGPGPGSGSLAGGYGPGAAILEGVYDDGVSGQSLPSSSTPDCAYPSGWPSCN
ncbi:hypothetical protein GGTG_05858 [Gaeumannomyces tritici R3-111a-1]|uniref:CBM1 domain-containing protein n=1 Tax=Gaeumannomyces tritici (strain R3-111a-1) TaxID=644352 RepID=J3NX51_GAET3|nr:hypothetical protein GGTG_05858 [Gaeumannomyces tritici R3-111a-1]EJT75933.1 hypothetical protein GGTG_05858 [Gaeumannomyces tritici R3-111a-1]